MHCAAIPGEFVFALDPDECVAVQLDRVDH